MEAFELGRALWYQRMEYLMLEVCNIWGRVSYREVLTLKGSVQKEDIWWETKIVAGKNTLVALKLIDLGVEKHGLTIRSSLSVSDARCQLEEVKARRTVVKIIGVEGLESVMGNWKVVSCKW